jgi:hypothetical protein
MHAPPYSLIATTSHAEWLLSLRTPFAGRKKKGLGALYRSAFIFPPCTAVPFLFPLIYPKKSTNSSPYFKKIFSHMFSGCGIIGAPINLHRRKEPRELRLYCNAALVVTNHSSATRHPHRTR